MSTTTHPFTPEEVMAFVDGELSADRAQSISAHLDQCAECSRLAAEQRGLSLQMTSWRVEVVPERVSGRVEAASSGKHEGIPPILGSVMNQRRGPVSRFAVYVACTVGAVLLVMAMAIPNLLRSRMAANEASAVGSLRTLNTAAVTYYSSYGHYPLLLENFGSSASGIASEDGAGLVDDILAKGGRKSGYLFKYRAISGFGTNNRGGYRISADPLEPGKNGQRRFSTNQTGTIFADGFSLDDLRTRETSSQYDPGENSGGQTLASLAGTGPMIARKVQLEIVVAKLDDARLAMERILREHKGYASQLSATAESGSAPMLVASLRVPADQLDVCLAELKKLGRVSQESQAGEEVTQQHLDLVARLKNSRNTEARLNGVIQQRSGPVKEILEVEKESARVRGEIEQMEAEQQTLEHRVNFATIDLKLSEEYKAQLSSPAPSVGMQLRNSAVNGFRNASESLLGIILFLAESGPTLLLWLLILAFPARLLWRRYQRSLAMS
jgi:type IV pilus assembly protein PilA